MPEKAQLKIALIGDYSPDVTAHVAIPKALDIASASPELQDFDVSYDWILTRNIPEDVTGLLADYAALWCVPASPYENMDGALAAIRYARENNLAFLGSCGGYQHAILEFTRNVLGHTDAGHTEIDPDTSFPLLNALTCSLVEAHGTIEFQKNSLVAKHHEGITTVSEQYRCSYGFNPEYVGLFDDTDLRISGHDATGEPRVIELQNHPFFIGVAYQPERSALQGLEHPLITAFVKAASLWTCPKISP